MKRYKILLGGFECALALAACGGSTPAASDASSAVEPSTSTSAAQNQVAAVEPRTTAVELVPSRVRNAYPSMSDLGKVESKRDATGWSISMAASPSPAPDHGEWAGFCWDLSPIDASAYSALVVELTEVPQDAEVDVTVENSKVKESVQQYLRRGSLDIDLTNFARARSEMARICIMAIGRPTAKVPTVAKFNVGRILVR